MSNNGETKNVAVWFEIPASDFGRAADFYETIFATKLKNEQFGEARMAVFPYERPGVSGCVMEAPKLAGNSSGSLAYFLQKVWRISSGGSVRTAACSTYVND